MNIADMPDEVLDYPRPVGSLHMVETDPYAAWGTISDLCREVMRLRRGLRDALETIEAAIAPKLDS